jgi:uncharacterized protein (TIGR03382 family)
MHVTALGPIGLVLGVAPFFPALLQRKHSVLHSQVKAMKFRILAQAFLGAMCLSFVGSASASFILRFDGNSVSSNTPPTGASADIEFAFSEATPPPDPSGDLTLDLTVTNTTGISPNPVTGSAGATEASLMGFGVDLPGGVTVLPGSYEVTPTTSFPYLLANVALSPFGGVDVYFSNNQNAAGGNPNDALTAGQSATIRLDLVTAIALADIEMQFTDVLSLNCSTTGQGCTDELATSVARFQDVNAGAGSDKLLGYIVTDDDPDEPQGENPAPATVALMGLGLAVLGYRRRLNLR